MNILDTRRVTELAQQYEALSDGTERKKIATELVIIIRNVLSDIEAVLEKPIPPGIRATLEIQKQQLTALIKTLSGEELKNHLPVDSNTVAGNVHDYSVFN